MPLSPFHTNGLTRHRLFREDYQTIRKRFAPLTVTEVDPVLDFIDRALTRLGLSTASRLPLLAAAEELLLAALDLTAGQEAQVHCSLERPGELQLSFRTGAGPCFSDDADLALPEGLSLRREDAAYIIPLNGGKPSRLNT